MRNRLFPPSRVFILFLLLAVGGLGCSVPQVSSGAQPVSHDLWDSLSRAHVSPEGWVDYAGFVEDSARLNAYLDLLSRHHPNEAFWTDEQRLAYWINAYNAFTVKLIVDNYPVEGIKEIKNGIPFVNTVWDIKFIEIEGQRYDLNNIEHGIIRSRFEEPRIHFAVNCASVSCPNLRDEAYRAERLDQQLNEQARAFLSDATKNVVRTDRVQLSKIFLWYRGDFTGRQGLIDFLNRYAPVKIDAEAEVEYLDYDWRLNIRENMRGGEAE